jgi:hypothetical protein
MRILESWRSALRERIPMLSAMTIDQLGAKMKCDRCGKRP